MFSWRVLDFLEVNERSLSLFTIIEPKPDILIIGYGDRPDPILRSPRLGYELYEEEKEKNREKRIVAEKRSKDVAKHVAKLVITMKQKRLNVQCLPTEDAIAAYNYLVSGKLIYHHSQWLVADLCIFVIIPYFPYVITLFPIIEDRLVAAALIPPDVVSMISQDVNLTSQLATGDDPWFTSRTEMFGGRKEDTYTEQIKKLRNLEDDTKDK